MYFSRAARYDVVDDHVVVTDPSSPRVITLDPWPEIVFQMADGTRTIAELRDYLAAQYETGAPDGLYETLNAVLDQLQNEKLVRLHETAAPLPFYLSDPISEQDPGAAKQAMEQDGFLKRGD